MPLIKATRTETFFFVSGTSHRFIKRANIQAHLVAGQFWYVTMAKFLVDALTPKLSNNESADQAMIQEIATPIQNDAKWKLFNGAPK